MEIIGQEVRSKATGVKCEIEGIEKGKVLVNVGSGKPVPMPLDMLLMPDELREEVQKALNPKGSKKMLTGIAGIIDVRRAPEDIKNPKTVTNLTKGDCLGTRSGDIYWDIVDNENFKWNPEVGGNFGRQKRLYSKNATPEGYSVWMLAHSSYNGSIAKSEKVFNKIEDNGDIVEMWSDDAIVPDYVLGEKRVVFVKNACDQYIFWGIVETTEIRSDAREVLHKYISDTYR
ncbi:MAG: hypothetical protein Q4F12_02410 [Erysipelotrichaceae bacterium]|nr:hypothetical protein [Erysipelotrichaceae bacterium]